MGLVCAQFIQRTGGQREVWGGRHMPLINTHNSLRMHTREWSKYGGRTKFYVLAAASPHLVGCWHTTLGYEIWQREAQGYIGLAETA